VRNDDVNVQKQSGYSQIDILEKLRFRQNDRSIHTLNLQFSTSSDIPRYDRLTEYRNGRLRFAEWYYGPQQRFLASYRFEHRPSGGFFTTYRAGLNYQNIEESRHQRNLGSNFRQHRVDKADVIGYNADAHRQTARSDFNVGIDGQFNIIRSRASNAHIVSGAEQPLDTRYPNGGSKMNYAALYAQFHYRLRPRKLIANAGLRLNHVGLRADFDDTSFFAFPYREARQSNTALSGNAGLVWLPTQQWKLALNLSSGFRAPNVDDLAKVFESAVGAQVVVPNPDLRPEHTYNADLGIAYQVDALLKLEASGFYTIFRDAIVTDRFRFNGQDSIFYNGQTTAVVASQNKARAYLYGFNAGITAHLAPRVTLYSSLNFTHGRYVGLNDVEVPLDHIPPLHGKTSVAYEQGRFSAEVFALYNGWKTLREYNPFGEDNLQYATALGMPGWYTLNLRGGVAVHRYLYIQSALENVMDVNYRQFASGISAPGRNFVLTLRSRL
jgi:hemoglobin/transferrin/lactoferrin receptor protein